MYMGYDRSSHGIEDQGQRSRLGLGSQFENAVGDGETSILSAVLDVSELRWLLLLLMMMMIVCSFAAVNAIVVIRRHANC